MNNRLLDQHGRPIQKEGLTQPVAEPGITAIRNAWSHSVATGLTPNRLASLLASAADGNLHDYLVLAEEMEERDPHYAALLGLRKRAVSGVTPTVTPASDSPLDIKIADDIRHNLAQHDGFTDLVEDMLDALGKGFSQVELIWARGKRNWWIDKFVHRDPKFFMFDRETGNEIRLIDEGDMVNGLPLAPFKWISHRAKLKSGLTVRGGLARLVAFGWICKSYTTKDWMAFAEVYGLPLRLGRYDAQATKSDVETLFRAVSNIGTDAAAVLPDSMRIDFEQINAGQGNDIFEKLARWLDEQTSKAVLGQTMATDSGSSLSQANVHNEVRHDLSKADARAISNSLNRDLVRSYVDLNYGVQDQYPRIQIEIDKVEDKDMILRNAAALIDRGLGVRESELRSMLGFSDPDPDDAILGGQSAPEAMQVASNRAGTETIDDLDELAGDLDGDWQDHIAGTADQLIALFDGADSYDEIKKRLATAFPDMDSNLLIADLIKTMIKARAVGDAPDV